MMRVMSLHMVFSMPVLSMMLFFRLGGAGRRARTGAGARARRIFVVFSMTVLFMVLLFGFRGGAGR